MAAAIHQTIAIVDRSNKVVGTSKQLKNVFKEAKMAYMERKAEIVAARRAKEEKELTKALKAASIADDARSDATGRSRRHRTHRKHHDHDEQRRPETSRHQSHETRRSSRTLSHSSRDVSPAPLDRAPPPPYGGLAQFNQELYGTTRSTPASPKGHDLVRRKTDLALEQRRPHRPAAMRSNSLDDAIDMDLAYGEFHPESLQLSPKVEQQLQKQEMAGLVAKAKGLLEEADCAQHSVRAIVAHLQKNPDAMAAVALTLAEISNLATKMAPAALASFKTAAPAVFAVLAAPEFLIAVGVGVGLTVVMFGGYKIIKKIKATSSDSDPGMDEMLDVRELDRIEHWRRGISDADTASVATSVEGEFITPIAAASMRDLHADTGSRRERRRSDKKKHKHRSHDHDTEHSVVGSESSSRSKKSSRSKAEKKEKALVKVHKPSPLRRIFTTKD